jgi:hypothetical protein
MADEEIKSATKPAKQSAWGWIWANTDNITKRIQVLALVVAAYWAYTRFFKVEAPSLETTAALDLKLDQYQSSGECLVRLDVTLRNIGHSSFDVKNAHISAWHSDPPRPTDASPVYFDLTKMREGQDLLNEEPPDLLLDQHHPPGSAASQDFTFGFKQLKGLYLFAVTSYDVHGNMLSRANKWSAWSCGN